MASINILLRQHRDICIMIKDTKEMIDNRNLDESIGAVARNINVLSGKLKLHLRNLEDYLYPRILAKGSNELLSAIESYIDELSEVNQMMARYMVKYNSRVKILNNKDVFREESHEVFEEIKKRLCHKDQDLYIPTLEIFTV